MSEKKHASNPGLARVIEKQVRNWEIARAQRGERASAAREKANHFVTIANIVGAGGKEVADRLGEKLGWPVFDHEILTTMAGDDKVRARLYKSMDEHDLGWYEETFLSLMQEEFRRNDYFHRLTEAILVLARQGPAIFVGRAADLILPKGKGLRVNLIASRQRCTQNFAERNKTSIEHARREVERIEAERGTFVENHFHVRAGDPTRFDLLINVERFTTDQVVDLILLGMQRAKVTH